MKVAIIGSRNLKISEEELKKLLPAETTEIVSGGAKGIDTCAKSYAMSNKIKYTEFLPQYEKYGKCAPIKRNAQIINYADMILAFWDGSSKGTLNVIKACKKINKKIHVYIVGE